MTFFTRRYLEEFFLYSSQFVLFYTIALLAAPPVLRPDLLPIIILIISLFIQIALLARFGHRPIARLAFSCITPVVYTLSNALVSPGTLADMASYFLWGISLYQGSIQALELVFRRKWPKRIAEIFMIAGTILSFVFFYFYMDLRIRLFNNYLSGELDYFALSQALTIKNFVPAFMNFLKPVQHIFFIFGVFMFGLFQLSDKVKQISLKYRIDSIYATITPPTQDVMPIGSQIRGEKHPVVILYADIWNFTPIAEKENPQTAFELLNRYYALWDIVVRRNHGIIEQFVGDTTIAVFGLLENEQGANNAVDCAFDFLRQFIYLQDELAENKLPIIKSIGIGIHAGTVAVGDLINPAGEKRLSVVGDAVNVAARLDSLCREFKQNLIISNDVYKNLSLEHQAEFEKLGEVLFRNKTQPQLVWGRK